MEFTSSRLRLRELAGIIMEAAASQDAAYPIGIMYVPRGRYQEQIGIFTSVKISNFRIGDVAFFGAHEVDIDEAERDAETYIGVGEGQIVVVAAQNEQEAWRALRQELIKVGLDGEVAVFADLLRGKPHNALYPVE